MSNFNTRKDRLPNGKAKPHNLKRWERYPDRSVFYNKNPAWWNRIYTTKIRRANDGANIKRIMYGTHPDGIAWMPDRKPMKWYY